jgi:hypothetical protein
MRNEIIEPKPEGIQAAVSIVSANAKRRVQTFVKVNNHYNGQRAEDDWETIHGASRLAPSVGCVLTRAACETRDPPRVADHQESHDFAFTLTRRPSPPSGDDQLRSRSPPA